MSTTSLCPSATREHGPGAKRVLPLLFLTCLLDAAGVGLIVPLLPTLIGSVAPLAIRDAATWGAALVMTFALLQLFFSPVLGSLSDRFGRRPVLVLAMLGFALSYLLLALADSLWMLFLGRALAGLTGASVATAMACAADLGTHGQRTRHFGWLYAGLALGMILGPALGGLLAVLALVFLGLQAVMVVWPFFVIEKFHWSSAWIGYSLALYGVLAVLAQTLGVNLCKRRLDDARLLRLGLALQGCGLLLFALVDSSFWLVCALLPFALGSLATPAMQGLLSARVPVDRQGELQGVLSSLMSLAAIVGPPLMSGLFHWGSGPLAPLPLTGAPFLAGALLVLAGLVLAWQLRPTGEERSWTG
ncbi:MFS transporter [Pseudomonas aeruginosa]